MQDGKIDEDLAKTAKEYTKMHDDAEVSQCEKDPCVILLILFPHQVFARALMRIAGVAWEETHKFAEQQQK